MTAKHPGVLELAHLVAALAGGGLNATDRERAVVLALELYRIDEISRMKLLEVARAAGQLEERLGEHVRRVGASTPKVGEALVDLGLGFGLVHAHDRSLDAAGQSRRTWTELDPLNLSATSTARHGGKRERTRRQQRAVPQPSSVPSATRMSARPW